MTVLARLDLKSAKCHEKYEKQWTLLMVVSLGMQWWIKSDERRSQIPLPGTQLTLLDRRGTLIPLPGTLILCSDRSMKWGELKVVVRLLLM